MPKTIQYKNGFDIDTDSVSDALREIADALDEGSAALQEVNEGHSARVEDVSEAELTIKYVTSNEDLITPIEYAEDH